MGHCVQAFIGSRRVLEGIVKRFACSKVIDLAQDLALLPLITELHDALEEGTDGSAAREPAYVFLDAKLERLLAAASDRRGLIYFETDYAGGHGTQCALAARGGEIVFGPASGPGTINAALRLLRVRTIGATGDEFDAIGLAECRSNEDWIEQSD